MENPTNLLLKDLLPEKEFDPWVRKVYLDVPKPSLQDNRGDVDRVLDTLEKQAGIRRPRVSFSMAQEISRAIHAFGFAVTLTLVQRGEEWEVVDVEQGDQRRLAYGLAVDLGSTNIAFYLLDLAAGQVIAQTSDENPQVQFGEDILTRIHHCEQPQGLDQLQKAVMGSLNRNMNELLETHGIKQKSLYALAVAGNTTMVHLFLGLSPYRICREPYIPVVNRPDIYRAGTFGIQANQRAVLYLLPNVGSYAGGDVLGGILVSGMHRDEELSLLVDVGTNAEIVLGNRDWLMVAAGAAGPALEGGVVKCGMRATKGAIEKVRVDRKSFLPTYRTINGGTPRGICGSGLVDLLAELFLSGLIDERGKIVLDAEPVTELDSVKAYRLVPGKESLTGQDIVLTELDIQNLLRTKGAMYTALTVITRQAGIAFEQLKHFFVAGTFGAFIDPIMAVTIGMVPDIPIERYKALYNSSGMGACLCLLSNGKRRELDRISRKITYVELNVEGDFMNLLNAAMFLPHTDKDQFPSVSRPK